MTSGPLCTWLTLIVLLKIMHAVHADVRKIKYFDDIPILVAIICSIMNYPTFFNG